MTIKCCCCGTPARFVLRWGDFRIYDEQGSLLGAGHKAGQPPEAFFCEKHCPEYVPRADTSRKPLLSETRPR